MRFSIFIAVFMIGGIILSGVVFMAFGGTEVTDGTGPGRIEIAPNTPIVANETGFEMTDAEVHFSLYVGDEDRYEHVMLCLYDQSGTTLASRDLGTFSKPTDYTTASIRTGEIPRYIVIDHPEFREYAFDYEILVWNPDQERYETGLPRDIEFQYPRNDTVGECA